MKSAEARFRRELSAIGPEAQRDDLQQRAAGGLSFLDQDAFAGSPRGRQAAPRRALIGGSGTSTEAQRGVGTPGTKLAMIIDLSQAASLVDFRSSGCRLAPVSSLLLDQRRSPLL